VFLLAVFGVLVMPTWAEETTQSGAVTKKYPPYPDVWGYELPWPDTNNRQSVISIFSLPDGDYLAHYLKHMRKQRRKDGSCCEYQSEDEGRSFFSGKKWDGKESDNYADEHREDRLSVGSMKPRPWILTDGINFQQKTKDAGRCTNNLDSHLVMLDPAKNVVAKKYLIYLLQKPIKQPVCYPSERNENLVGKQRSVTMRVEGIRPYIIPLEDGTFLLYDMDGTIIMRFDRDLSTKSALLNRRVFVVDRQAMDAFVEEFMKQKNLDYNDQTLNDAVYAYVTKLKKAGAQ
jgi:hypothetical protein